MPTLEKTEFEQQFLLVGVALIGWLLVHGRVGWSLGGVPAFPAS